MSESRKPCTYTYILTGRNSRGRRETEVIQANGADAAFQAFEDRGFHDIVLHTDDFAATFLVFDKGLLKPRDMLWARGPSGRRPKGLLGSARRRQARRCQRW